MVAEASENWPGLEGEAAAELGAGGRPLPPPLPPEMPVLALLLLELLAESCFFFELLNFALPESVSFNFSSNLLIGLSMIKPSPVVTCLGKVKSHSSPCKLQINVLKYSAGRHTAEQRLFK